MEKETRIKCDRSYNELYGRRGILPEEAKSSAIREIARFYDSLKTPYLWICENGIPRLCYLKSINLYRWDTVHHQICDDISGPGEQNESVNLQLSYIENRRIVECYRSFSVNVLGDMDETYSEMIEKKDIRIPSSWELSMAEYEDGVPIYRKRFSKAEDRKNSYVEWLNGVIKSYKLPHEIYHDRESVHFRIHHTIIENKAFDHIFEYISVSNEVVEIRFTYGGAGETLPNDTKEELNAFLSFINERLVYYSQGEWPFFSHQFSIPETQIGDDGHVEIRIETYPGNDFAVNNERRTIDILLHEGTRILGQIVEYIIGISSGKMDAEKAINKYNGPRVKVMI